MDRNTEQRWRTQLDEIGQHKVRATLELRPGHGTELMHGFGGEAPFPTRAFCERWCRGEQGASLGVPLYAGTLVAMALLVTVSFVGAIGSWSPAKPPQPMQAAPLAPTLSQQTAGSPAILQNNSVISTKDDNSMMPGCSAVSATDNLAHVHAAQPCRKAPLPSALQQGPSGNGP